MREDPRKRRAPKFKTDITIESTLRKSDQPQRASGCKGLGALCLKAHSVAA